ncbi:hdhd3 [Symbiodinium pilosum]|uniref:Hdhd3 protein n=1 Tax=Symbiodinium pilosum TaxID=2952 RepID=A0A812WIY5_SYMPI|nr:hdhd3 [Symbiodinium pilosum]
MTAAAGIGGRLSWKALWQVSGLGTSFEAVFDDLYTNVFCGEDAWELLPNTATSLESLRSWCSANDCQLGVMSNMDSRLSTILQSLGILDKFDFVLTSYEARADKPSPVIFKKALEKAGLPPSSHALHCGDSFKRDVAGAIFMNWTAVLVDGRVDEVKPLEPTEDCNFSVHGDVLAMRVPHIGHIEGLLAG